jgi:hypothetical protein
VGDVDVDICMYILVSFTSICMGEYRFLSWRGWARGKTGGGIGFEFARVEEREHRGGVKV